MADETSPSQDSGTQTAEPPRRSNPARSITITVLLLGILLFAYSVFADRLTPYTDQATVQAYVVRVAPDVSGRVLSVNLSDNQIAKTDEVLFTIDPERFEIAVDIAEAKLAGVGLTIGASTAALAAAEAKLAEAEAKLVNTRQQTARVFELVKKGQYAKARGDQAQAALDAAIADVDRAKAEVEEARQNLGPQGADNPQIRQAQAELRAAQRDLCRHGPARTIRWRRHQSATDQRPVRRGRSVCDDLHRCGCHLDPIRIPREQHREP